MSDQLANEAVRPARRFPRRTDRTSPDRLANLDQRTRLAKRFAAILAAIKAEYGDAVDPVKAAELARLKMISESVQGAFLAGNANVDRVVQVSNMILRAERQLVSKSEQ